eukprot:COSAG02_NODE_65308_length_258_cov_0.735849_1_plen_39_part_01
MHLANTVEISSIMDGQLDVEQIDSHGAFYWFFEVCRRTM